VQGIQPFRGASIAFRVFEFPTPSLENQVQGLFPVRNTQRPVILQTRVYNIAAYVSCATVYDAVSSNSFSVSIRVIAEASNSRRVIATSNAIQLQLQGGVYYNLGVWAIEVTAQLLEGEQIYLSMVSSSPLPVLELGTRSLTILDLGI